METPNDFNSQTPNGITSSPAPSSTPKLGIVSLALSLIGFILYFIPFIAGYIAGIIGVSYAIERSDTVNVLGWFVSWCGNFLGLVALVLGGISVASEKKNAFGIAGIVLGTLLTIGCLASVVYNLIQM